MIATLLLAVGFLAVPVNLAQFPAGPTKAQRFQLQVDTCRQKKEGFSCPVRVRLLDGDKQLGVQDAVWDYPSDTSTVRFQRNEEGAFQLGDPNRESHFSLQPRTLRLAPGRVGLLLTEVAGFDHLTYAHQLYVEKGGKLTRPWKLEGLMSGAPEWDFVSVADPDRDEFDELLVIHVSQVGLFTDEGTEEWSLTVMGWDPKKEKLSKIPPAQSGAKAYAAILGSYPTLKKAQEAQKTVSCPMAIGLYKSDSFPRLKKGFYILASLHLSRTMANNALAQAKECGLKGYLKRAY